MDNSFEYNYCAKEQAEVKSIREKYAPQPEPQMSKLEQLRQLDRSVTKKSTAVALTLGIIGTLLMGTGMSLIMTPIAERLGLWAWLIGLSVGLLGISLVILAYPCYKRITEKERARIAPEILRLSDELLQ